MIKNIIVVSDTHCGCRLGLCPPKMRLDDGGEYEHSKLQAKTWQMWLEFWHKWVPQVTKGEKFIVVHNGDIIDGVHHQAVTQISHNLEDQMSIAREVMAVPLKMKNCAEYYQIRGTEAHSGKSAQNEEMLARELKAIEDEFKQRSRWEMWLRVGDALINFGHHVGVTSSASYEATAVYKELVEAYTEAGRQKLAPPDCVIRSHRHRYFKTEISTETGLGMSVITPGWQLKTPNAFRYVLGRTSTPQIGGILIRHGDEDNIYTRTRVWHVERPREVRI